MTSVPSMIISIELNDDISNDLVFINFDYGNDLFSNDLDQLVRTQ